MPRSLAPLLTALLALVVPAQAAPTQPAAADARFEALGARFIAESPEEVVADVAAQIIAILDPD